MNGEFEVSGSETEKVKEQLNKLEQLTILPDSELLQVVLVHLDLKPAAVITVPVWEPLADLDQSFRSELQQLTAIFRQMGIFYEKKTHQVLTEEAGDLPEEIFYISKSPQHTVKLRDAFGRGNEQLRAELLGYPQTAIEAFMKGESASIDNLEINDQPEEPFLYFRPSQNHWQEELATLRPKIATVKTLMPRLYERLMHRRK
jgi:hypothetical protein